MDAGPEPRLKCARADLESEREAKVLCLGWTTQHALAEIMCGECAAGFCDSADGVHGRG